MNNNPQPRMTVDFKLLDPDALPPKRQSKTAAGFDLHSLEEYRLYPGERRLFSTGIAMAIPDFCVGLIWPRSGLATKGIDTMAGVIDSDYRGEIKVLLINHSEEPILIEQGQRIAQLLIQSVNNWLEDRLVLQLDDTSRGYGGFGSTGA